MFMYMCVLSLSLFGPIRSKRAIACCARHINGCRHAQQKDPKQFENDYSRKLSFSNSKAGIGMSRRNG